MSSCTEGHPPIPVFPKSIPALFSTESPRFLEKEAYLAVIYWKVVVDVVAPFSWSFPGYLLSLLLISPRSCSVPNVGFLVRAFFMWGGCFLFVLLVAIRGIEPQVLCVLGKCLSTELHPQPLFRVFLAALIFRCTFAAVWSEELVETGYQGGNWHGSGGNGRGRVGDLKKKLEETVFVQRWWHMPIIPALRRQR